MKTLSMPGNLLSKQNQVHAMARNFFVASALILFYSALLTAVLPTFLDVRSVNPIFLSDLTLLSLGAVLIFGLTLVALRFRSPQNTSRSIAQPLTPVKYVLVGLVPLSPIIRYLIANQEISLLQDVVALLLSFLGLLLVFTAIIPYLLSRFASGRVLLSAANAFGFTLLNMASVSQSLNWLTEGSTIIQFGLFMLAFAVTWFLLGLKRNDLAFVILVFILGGAIIQILFDPDASQTQPGAEARGTQPTANDILSATVGTGEPTVKPNIYLLVYDSYVSNEVMLSYGIDNSPQERYLVEQGFTIYPKTYSIGSYTLSSMNSVFNLSTDVHSQSRFGADGNGVIQTLFSSLGYQTGGVFRTDYFFRGVDGNPGYDFYTPQMVPTYQLLTTAIWMGEFRFDLGFERVRRTEYDSVKREAFINASTNSTEPTLIYAHSTSPGHSQYTGVCLSDQVEQHADRLKFANEEMTRDLSTILAHDPGAVIIIAGDHGPYLTKNCLKLTGVYDPAEVDRTDLQDRFGAFLAVRWPSDDYHEYDQIAVLQDIFPAILAWMYQDGSILDLRLPAETITHDVWTAGVAVSNGIIMGGVDEGEPLYLAD